MRTQAYNLNLIPNDDIQVIHISQYDRAVTLRFYIYDGDSLYPFNYSSTSFYIRGTKPNGQTFEHIMNKIRNEYVYYSLQQDMTDVCGDVYCNLEMIEGDNRTGSQAFILRVQKDARGEI